MAGRQLVIRIGIDASRYNAGMAAAKAKAEKTGSEISSILNTQAAKAQEGTTLSDRVGAMLNPKGVALITEVTRDNLADAKRQATDLAAMMTKMQAKNIDWTTQSEEADKFYQMKGMYESVSEAIGQYGTQVRQTVEAQKQEESAFEAQTRGVSGFDSALAKLKGQGRKASEVVGHLVSTGRQLIRVPFTMLQKGASAIRNIGSQARSSNMSLSSMVRSIRNVGVVSLGLRVAGAALGRLKSIVSEYISQNEALQAQVNGLKSAMGQALAPAINVVVNALSQLMPYVLGVANAIGSLIGGLFGSSWTQAASGAQKTASSTKQAAAAQKDLNRQLLGFDQITRLEDTSQSAATAADTGTGSSTPMASITAKTPAWMERFKKSFSDLFSSEDFKAANIGGKLGKTLQTGLDWIGSEAMAFDWSGAGKKLRENWDSFWNSGVVESFGHTVGVAMGGIADLVIGFMGPTWNELTESYRNQGVKGALIYISGMTTAWLGKIAGGFFTKLISPMFQGLSDFFREHGHQSLAGFFQGLADKTKEIGQNIKTKFVDPLVTSVKNLLGIHSPSTVFAGFAQNCIDGFLNRWSQLDGKLTEKLTGLETSVASVASSIKSAFNFNWSLPHIKVPHLQVSWRDAGYLAQFFGISSIPSLSVSWYAKGGILDGAQIFGRMGNTYLGGGEAGREAVLPLDRNTGWMDDIADRVAARVGEGGDTNATIYLQIDGKTLVKYVINGLRSQARAGGSRIVGV